jgi:hypothetical protein
MNKRKRTDNTMDKRRTDITSKEKGQITHQKKKDR